MSEIEPAAPVEEAPLRPTCSWCTERSVTDIFVEGNPDTKRSRTAPVCARHERQFMSAGAVSRDAWHDESFRREWKAKRAAAGRA